MRNVLLYTALTLFAVVVVLVLVLKLYEESGSRRLEIILDPGFSGRLWLVEDPKLQRDSRGVYVLRQRGDTLPVPSGIAGGESSVRFYSVVRVLDKNGNVVSEGDQLPDGKVTLRGYGAVNDPSGPSGTPDAQRYYFDFRDR